MNNKRKFELPSVDDLLKEQDVILRLPESGQFLVIGGPGTGKSVVSLIRRRRIEKEKNYIFLVYNHVLMRSTKQMIEGEMNGETWKRWFNDEFKNLTDEFPPRKSDESKEVDFDKAIIKLQEHFEGLEISENDLNFIIDEGQDMPPKFYDALIEMGFINFFVVADQNQQITEQNSSIVELQDALAVDRIYELTENHRNTYEIAKLASKFYTDPATPPPKLPKKPPKLKPPKLHEYDGTDEGFELIIKRILVTAYNHPKQLIGIFTLSNDTRKRYIDALNKNKVKFKELSKLLVSTYSFGDSPENIDFNRGGIVVLNSASVKGLEFDSAFIVDIDEFNRIPNVDALKKIFYVMVSRARYDLTLLRNIAHRRQPKLDGILPADEEILGRVSA